MNRNSKVPKFIRRIEMVQKRSIMYYQQQDSHPFLKIVVALPTMVASCRGKSVSFINIRNMQSFTCMADLLYFCMNHLHAEECILQWIITELSLMIIAFQFFSFYILRAKILKLGQGSSPELLQC